MNISVYVRQGRITCVTVLMVFVLFSEALLAEDIVIDSNTAWPAGSYDYNNILITKNAVLTFNGPVTLSADNLTIDSGASISAKGTGFAAGKGIGAGGTYSGYGTGAGFGGKGGSRNNSGGPVYGSALTPGDPGSGGGNGNAGVNKGGAGGGAIILNVNSLTINGVINAGGADGILGNNGIYGGGGAGGSIYILTEQFNGSGTISANGGYGRFGGGAGGRIAVYYQSSTFAGTAQAKGGTGITIDDCGQDGTVALVDSLNNILYAGPTFRFEQIDSPFTFDRVVLNASKTSVGGSIELIADELSLDANSIFTISGDSTHLAVANLDNDANSAIILTGSSVLTITSVVNIISSSITTAGPQNLVLPTQDINLSTAASLKWGPGSYAYNKVSLTGKSSIVFNGAVALQAQSITIDPCCSISAVGTGFPGEQGPGVGGIYSGSGTGGGYGGKGGSRNGSGGAIYGSELLPADLGSGGGNSSASVNISGAGGGAIQLDVDRLIVNGIITADGTVGILAASLGIYGGGGSGGSVLINAKNLSGSGNISANGGYGRFGGGGGGRVAVYYGKLSFDGTVQAKGGTGSTAADYGQDGTVNIIKKFVNAAPVSDAGGDQAVNVGDNVVLDGSLSSDADGDLLIYNWAFTSLPLGSSAILNNADSTTPSFVADVAGTYIISLVVNDGELDSASDTVSVSTINRAPVANAGTDKSVVAGNEVALYGSASFDPDGDTITYIWTFTSKPGSSKAVLANPNSVSPAFTPDVPGTYVLNLVVNDGSLDSPADSVNINVSFVSKSKQAITLLKELRASVDSLKPCAFKNRCYKKAMDFKINFVIKMVEKGHYKKAIMILKYDILKKTDGCARCGTADRNDWIINRTAQASIYAQIVKIIDVLESMN